MSPYSVEAVTYDVREALWDEMEENRETACCPVPRWMIETTTGAQIYRFNDCDDSLRCRSHAHRKADQVLKAARDWLDLEVVYYANVPQDPGLINRIRSARRPGRKAARSWYVVRVERGPWGSEKKVVHLFATRDLSGSRTQKPPRSWEPLLPEEAIERLAEALRLPGVLSFSPRWVKGSSGESEPTPQDSDGPDEGDEGEEEDRPDEAQGERWVPLPSVMPENRDAVMEKASAIAKQKWGFRPTTDFFPADRAPVEEFIEIINFATKVVRLQSQKKPPTE